jgi:hypothetical protein
MFVNKSLFRLREKEKTVRRTRRTPVCASRLAEKSSPVLPVFRVEQQVLKDSS